MGIITMLLRAHLSVDINDDSFYHKNMKAIINSLEEYGLDGREAALYMASLQLGETSMSALARRAGVKRTTAYLGFKSLEKKGLMGSFKMRSGLRFVATRPELLISNAQKKLEELQSLLPELKAFSRQSEYKPRIYYYEGKEGYLVAAEDSLKEANSTVRHVGSLAEAHKIVGLDYDVKYYIPARIKKHILFNALYFRSETEEEIKNRNHAAELREIRYLPEKYSHKTSMLIYGEKIAIFSTKKELITVIIESEQIAESERRKFDLIWDLLGKQNL